MRAAPLCDPSDNVFTVDYDRRPFCYVRANDAREAVGLAGNLLALALRADPKRAAAPAAPARPPLKEMTKLRARRPTESERHQFAAKVCRNGVASPYLAAVMIG